MITASVTNSEQEDQVVTFQTFCDGTIEVGGWNFPSESLDLQLLEVIC